MGGHKLDNMWINRNETQPNTEAQFALQNVSECTAKEKTLFGIAHATRLPSYGDLLYALEVAGISDDNVDKIIRRASIYCPTYRKISTRNEIENDKSSVPRL